MVWAEELHMDKYGYKKDSSKLRWLMAFMVLFAVALFFTCAIPKYRKGLHLTAEPGKAEWHSCNLQLVESIPVGLNFSKDAPHFLSTFEAWKMLLNLVENNLDIGALYFTLRGSDVVNDTSASQGEEIFNGIIEVGRKVDKKIRIAQSSPSAISPDKDTADLKKLGVAEVRSVDFKKLFGGVLHTKLWVVDSQHFYIGSANMDWRSLTQVKEMGVLGTNCPEISKDLTKIFEEYWYLGAEDAIVPENWPSSYNTMYNYETPMLLDLNESFKMAGFLSSAPPKLSASGRMHDVDSIINTILTAEKYINIAVMDYYPLMIYTEHVRYWPYIDNALRKAAIENKVEIRMLISRWKHSKPMEDSYLRSLADLTDSSNHISIIVKRFVVPVDDIEIPFTRVNHNKYMVTDNTAYIGTSNWSGDYFTNTAGIGLVLLDRFNKSANTLRADLKSVFDRDWNSEYTELLI